MEKTNEELSAKVAEKSQFAFFVHSHLALVASVSQKRWANI